MTGRVTCASVCLLVLVGAPAPTALAAQEDFRNLDRGRPLRVEDAYPIKFREWELELGAGLAGIEGGDVSGATVIELKTGLLRNVQFGVEAHVGLEREEGASSSGVEEFAAHLLFNLNQEGARSPAFGIRADLATPGVGDVGHSDVSGRVVGLMTRTVGQSRIHVNGGYHWASVGDGGERVELGVAVDRTLGLSSRLIAADLFVEAPPGASARVWVDVGTRIQWSKRAVLDVGLFSRVDEWSDGVPNLGIVIGWSRAFGIRGLVPVPDIRRPRLR